MRRVLPAAALLLAAALLAGLTAPAPRAQAQTGSDGRVAGFGAYVLAGERDRLAAPGGRVELERMRRAGANTLLLDSVWDVPSQTSNRIAVPDDLAQQEEVLSRAATLARSVGLNVMLMPKISCSSCPADKRWRGVLQPSDPERFLVGSKDPTSAEYGAPGTYLYMSNYYADLAARIGAVTYFIGSEMASTQRNTGEWQIIALEARQRYNGRTATGPRLLAYQANWDSMREVGFWDEVDIAGVSAYVPLSNALQPNLADLLDAWRSSDVGKPWQGVDWYAEIKAFQESTKSAAAPSGKKVLFGEVGYQSALQAARSPWITDKTDGYDAQLQADAYQAVLTMFDDEPWWLGALWWEWVSTATSGDLGYSPRDKLAEQLLTKWYAGERPPTPTTSLVGTTRPTSKGQPVPEQAGPTSPAGRTTVSRPVPLAPRIPQPTIRGTAPVAVPTTPPPAATAAPLPSLAASPEAALGNTRALDRSPELPPVLAAVPVGTVEDALRRAAYREELRRAGAGALALLLVALATHAVLVGPRLAAVVRRRAAWRRMARR